ncbi:hypothetical protein EYF80_036368 [Liparis tanakae]|uniref:Uncharacterized protein n=1 Tax=Liparis tanakae TaxID=230148 RepID=A0A4Z2GIU3_9TELE|nr:hypothetical protein EYF80_036368 [Liparis tanakae]
MTYLIAEDLDLAGGAVQQLVGPGAEVVRVDLQVERKTFDPFLGREVRAERVDADPVWWPRPRLWATACSPAHASGPQLVAPPTPLGPGAACISGGGGSPRRCDRRLGAKHISGIPPLPPRHSFSSSPPFSTFPLFSSKSSTCSGPSPVYGNVRCLCFCEEHTDVDDPLLGGGLTCVPVVPEAELHFWALVVLEHGHDHGLRRGKETGKGGGERRRGKERIRDVGRAEWNSFTGQELPLRIIQRDNRRCVTVTHLDLGGGEAGAAVHALQRDGVELAFVQVHHGQLAGLVGGGQRSAQGELELVPEPLCRRRGGIGARVHRAGLVVGEGVAVSEVVGAELGSEAFCLDPKASCRWLRGTPSERIFITLADASNETSSLALAADSLQTACRQPADSLRKYTSDGFCSYLQKVVRGVWGKPDKAR